MGPLGSIFAIFVKPSFFLPEPMFSRLLVNPKPTMMASVDSFGVKSHKGIVFTFCAVDK